MTHPFLGGWTMELENHGMLKQLIVYLLRVCNVGGLAQWNSLLDQFVKTEAALRWRILLVFLVKVVIAVLF